MFEDGMITSKLEAIDALDVVQYALELLGRDVALDNDGAGNALSLVAKQSSQLVDGVKGWIEGTE